MPAKFFDSGQSVCLSVLLFDIKCYGCGMTRAIQHIIHFDFEAAYLFNKLSFLVFPVLIFMWGEQIWTSYQKVKVLRSK